MISGQPRGILRTLKIAIHRCGAIALPIRRGPSYGGIRRLEKLGRKLGEAAACFPPNPDCAAGGAGIIGVNWRQIRRLSENDIVQHRPRNNIRTIDSGK